MSPNRPADDKSGEENPLSQFLSQFGITPGSDGTFDMNNLMASLEQAMSQISRHMASSTNTDSDGLNWTATRDIARKVCAASGADPSPDASDIGQAQDAVALADLWLDQHTTFDRLTSLATAWSRAEWIENTFDVWQQLTSPIAASLASALPSLLDRSQDDELGLQAMMEPLMKTAASGMFAGKIGSSIAALAAQAVTACDLSLPLTKIPVVALLPAKLSEFGDGLEMPLSDVRLYMAVRETARQRLFASVGWLGPQLVALIQHYARGVRIDPSALEEGLEMHVNGALDSSEIEKITSTVADKLFEPVRTPEQEEILERIETLIALVEGWVDDVSITATAAYMPQAPALLESVRRRRASNNPVDQALKSLLNLELRPRRVRDAHNLWAAIRTQRGADERDAVWSHPDLIPTAHDLDDPLGFVERDMHSSDTTDLDAELAKLLDEEGRDNPPSQ